MTWLGQTNIYTNVYRLEDNGNTCYILDVRSERTNQQNSTTVANAISCLPPKENQLVKSPAENWKKK